MRSMENEMFLSADERQRLEIDRLSVRVMEFALYGMFCAFIGLKKNNVDSLNRFMAFAKSQNYKFVGEV